MKMLHKNTASFLLMFGSLALLAAFLGIWLKKVYEGELVRLKEQTNFLFLNSVREMEDELFGKLLARPVAEAPGDSCEDNAGKTVVQRQFDSTRVILFQQKSELPDSIVQISIHSRVDEPETGQGIKGAMAFVVAMAGNEQLLDSIPFRLDSIQMAPLLEKQVEKAFANSDLPRGALLLRLTGPDSLREGVIRSVSYNDIVNGGRYAVQVGHYTPYLLREMAPQILFALLLFATVCTAFFVIYKNLLRQQRLTELKNDFIRNVTHELKTPITTVGVAIEALGDFDALKNPEKTREYLDISRHELNRLSLLVDKVLKMSQFENARPELKISTFDLKGLVAEVLDSFKLQIAKLGASVEFKAEGVTFMVEGDPSHLASVVFNLIDNALKYSKDRPVLEIWLEAQGDRYRLVVSDRGMGIPPEYLNRIFDPFFRVPAGDRHDVKGHGLGLSYVSAIVRQHHGQIAVESSPGKGARFIITLPSVYEPR